MFLFGSKSNFNTLCYELVTQIKEKYPQIRRIYIRAEYPYISESYKTYLLEHYEVTYYPESVIGAKRLVYIKRNFEMIDRSHFCIVYYNKKYNPVKRKSGTKLALDYAIKHNKIIYQFPTSDIN